MDEFEGGHHGAASDIPDSGGFLLEALVFGDEIVTDFFSILW